MYLSPPPSSVNSERLFSVAGSIYTENRNRLSPDNEENIMKKKSSISCTNKILRVLKIERAAIIISRYYNDFTFLFIFISFARYRAG